MPQRRNLQFTVREKCGLGKHEIVTASYTGWGELQNGELLRTAVDDGFDVFVTGDRSIVYKQDLAARQVAIVALSANNWRIIKNYVPQILAATDRALPGSFQAVECGIFSRKKITR
ncbi:MAG: hypothetical protein ABSB35_42305 [Bryobacteraceae bacterium]